MSTTQVTEIRGVIVMMSAGEYRPFIEVQDVATRQVSLCDYRSEAAMAAGLSNPKHWAHDVYRTLDDVCTTRQAELQGEDS